MTLAVGSVVAIVADDSGETLQTGAQQHVFKVAELASIYRDGKYLNWAVLEVVK